MKRILQTIKEMSDLTGAELDDIGWLVFHQANRFMTKFFVKKMKFNPESVPYRIDRFGNTSSTSMPFTIVSVLHNKLKGGDQVMVAGFGAGFSMGTSMIKLDGCKISPEIEY